MTTIGIDLGTSNSIVAYWSEDRPVIIPNILGEHLTPSIVSVDDNGEILTGQIAKERLISHPHMTVSAFKRYMGSEKTYSVGSYTFTPEELSSFILKALKSDAEACLGEEVTEAVISVPAYFNDRQRKATKKAAELAGLKVERLISEPTAAAIAYGLHLEESDTKFLVFDLGGGTFDVSILELFEGIMEVKSIAGDNFLGGEDFTNLLFSHFMESAKIDPQELDANAHSALWKQAELCKRELGGNHTGSMQFTYGEENFEVKVSRSEFEKLARSLILRLRQPVERALSDASLRIEEIDAVILIGGATRMPIIKTVVSKMFGRLPFSTIHPDEAVGIGAAVQVALKERNEALQELILTDVCPYTLGTSIAKRLGNHQIDEGHFKPIIERNTPIPVSKVERFYTMHDQQSDILIDVYQGESRRIENNLKLGEMLVKVPVSPAGEQAVDVRYTYDLNGLLEVEVTILSTGEKQTMMIEQNPGSLSEAEMNQRMEELKAIKIHPRERTENRLLLAKGERLYEEALGDKREEVAFILEKFERVLASQDEIAIKKAAQVFKAELASLERWTDY
ncbi:molecular chaperone HscC [Pseudobacillus badius]|uniref:molecular chaperone HscC n=1 Tax=Bacillus badius TaxID=1455 RepID=UPI0007B04675|nr:molecular chaperone HscC [Bacillus badius]KZO00786.1 molecular chaperone HscC [Bacillus badius]MED0666978.1 molecular chaperone HscC [Bacillus badius]OCS88194.1 molecular chaperone HscC [Bacillus badius]OVE53277.1 molecular chaperone HscC [Bacillus badius]TDW05612.1 molecular chaperone HscC [Bacillus badius]